MTRLLETSDDITMDPILQPVQEKLDSAIHHFKVEIAGIRAGRANPSLIENVLVDAYGAKMKMNEVGTIAAAQPTLITVQVWDAGLVTNVIKGIQEAQLGLNASNEGQVVRVPIPPLTQERREEFIKLLHQKMEDARVAMRQIRQDSRSTWQDEKTKGTIGEDEFFRREKILQELIEKKTLEMEEAGKTKESELSEI